jgi:hypothetical protein
MAFSITFIIYTSGYLPENIATHFDVNNAPDGWMSRNSYIVLLISLIIAVPAMISFGISALSSRFPNLVNVPNRDYWLAPERRDESLLFLASHGQRLGRMIIVLMTGLHYVILVANQSQPPRLPGSWFMAMLIGFGFALTIWVVALYRRFPKP